MKEILEIEVDKRATVQGKKKWLKCWWKVTVFEVEQNWQSRSFLLDALDKLKSLTTLMKSVLLEKKLFRILRIRRWT
jgi:ATP-dependent helicase/DNAse subunit B